jgi:hypothetical protein
MAADEFRHWRYSDVAERLRLQSWHPPKDWPCWAEPSPALPIDKAITALRDSNRVPRLRPREKLNSIGLRCCYYAARFAVAMAADVSTMAANDDPVEMARRWHAREQAVHNAIREIAVVVESLRAGQSGTPLVRWPRREPVEVCHAYEALPALRQALDQIAKHARSSRRVYQHDQGDVWRLVFAADLGFFWRVLTGSNPTRADPFIGFVAAAFESLSDDLPAVPWERTTRRAIAMELDWDRYDTPDGFPPF